MSSAPILPPPKHPPKGSFKASHLWLQSEPQIVDAAPSPSRSPLPVAVDATQYNNAELRPAASHSPRRYDLALAVAGVTRSPVVVSGVDEAEGTLVNEGESMSSTSDVIESASDEETRVMLHPPPGAVGAVRPPVKRVHSPPPALDALLQNTAEGLAVINEADGAVAFDVVIKDEVFHELSCRISVGEGGVTATFRVGDATLRRLIEAEAGRLRALLGERGLTVGEISVVVDERAGVSLFDGV